VKKKIWVTAVALFASAVIFAGNCAAQADNWHDNDNDHHDHDKDRDHHHDHPPFFQFVPGTIVLSRTVYKGTADTITIGESLPPGCQPAGSAADAKSEPSANVTVPVLKADQPPATIAVAVSCGYASDNGEAPNLNDSHNVWNNASSDGSFGVSSPIRLDDLTLDGHLLGTLRVPSHEIVTSFSSKSELALNRSVDGKTLTFMGYRGGPGCPTLTLSGSILTQGTNVGPISPTAKNLIDVSASSTPGLCDPTNPAVASYIGASGPTAYYRSVAEVDPWGHIFYTDTDDYSGDNSRAVMKGDNWLYYVAGNDNSGNLPKKQLLSTQLGVDLAHSTGAELIVPGQAPLVPPANNMLGFFALSGDKPGKDTNFRGLTIFDNTLYVTKGSGGNGVNTVYQVGPSGMLPTTANAPGTPASTLNFTIAPLPGFPQIAPTADTSTTGGTANAGGYYPFGIWFANSSTLYVCNEGDLVYTAGQANVAASSGDLATTMFGAGLQKWSLKNGTWVFQYVIQRGLNIGVPYSVPNYPASLDPATDGCRNIVGIVNRDGTATILAITSTASQNGDNGADPNKLVKVTDLISATTPATSGDLDTFVTIRSARAGEAFRGVALAPQDGDDDRGFGRGDDWGHDRGGDDGGWGR